MSIMVLIPLIMSSDVRSCNATANPYLLQKICLYRTANIFNNANNYLKESMAIKQYSYAPSECFSFSVVKAIKSNCIMCPGYNAFIEFRG